MSCGCGSGPLGPMGGGCYPVTQYGASPTATAARNDLAFQRAADAAAADGGGLVCVPAGRFAKLATLTLGANVGIVGEGDATILDYSGVVAQSIGITVTGTAAASVALTGNAVEGAKVLSLPASTFPANSWIKVSSTAVTGSTNLPKGEINRVNDSATSTLFNPLCDTYNTANAAAAALLTLIPGNSFTGFVIEGPDDETVLFSGILVDMTEGATFEHVKCRLCHFYGIGIQDSVLWSVDTCEFGPSNTGALAYGVAIFNAAQDGTVDNVRGQRLRHVVTHGGFSSRPGVPRRTVTSNSVGTEMRNSAFDIHAGAEDVQFNNCTSMGSESDGFTLEGASFAVSNCTVRDSVGPGFHLNPQSVKPYAATLSNCRVTGKGSAAVRSAYQLQVNAGFELFDGVSINGGEHSDCRYGLRTINAQVGRITNLSISGGTYKQCGLDGDAVLGVTHAQGVSIGGGVVIDDTTGSLDAISLTDVIEFSVGLATIRLTGTGGCRGVRCLTTTTDGVIDNVYVDTGASGIGVGFADTCTNIVVGASNQLRNCPTTVSFGTGAGHTYVQPPAVSADRGDLDIVLTHASEPTQRFATVLTSNADITPPGANVRCKFRVVRQASATGAFSVNVVGVTGASLPNPGTSMEVESNGAGSWFTTLFP